MILALEVECISFGTGVDGAASSCHHLECRLQNKTGQTKQICILVYIYIHIQNIYIYICKYR